MLRLAHVQWRCCSMLLLLLLLLLLLQRLSQSCQVSEALGQ
jgi:hypothetical protein